MRTSSRPLPRLFIEQPILDNQALTLDHAAAHYLVKVLRLKPNDDLLLFNGTDGEWQARLSLGNKKTYAVPTTQTQKQPKSPDLIYAFAPLKGARLDYISQKAVEMGAGTLQPLITQRTIVRTINTDRMKKNTIEAAEQCGILTLPRIEPIISLPQWLNNNSSQDRILIFCDENAPNASPIKPLQAIADKPLALLIGPEGGFTEDERSLLLNFPTTQTISLGSRILRADTAAVAALSLIEACQQPPSLPKQSQQKN